MPLLFKSRNSFSHCGGFHCTDLANNYILRYIWFVCVENLLDIKKVAQADLILYTYLPFKTRKFFELLGQEGK